LGVGSGVSPSWALAALAGLLLGTSCLLSASDSCFIPDANAPIFSARTITTNGTILWQVRMIQATIFVPTGDSSCTNDCSITNVTVTGGVLLSYVVVPPQLPPQGALVVVDCDFVQTPGATNANVSIESPCFTLSRSYDYPDLPEVIQLTLESSREKPSEVRLSWNSRTNTMYQVHYSADPSAEEWNTLGDPIIGNGMTNCITDTSLAPSRFYRVSVAP
jgi:hypothetical protein